MNIEKISADFAVTGQLAPEDIAKLADKGFRAIVCNRPDAEEPDHCASGQLAQMAADADMKFAYIPIVPGNMSDADAQELASFLQSAEGPVLGYCRSGARARKLWERAQEIAPPPA